MQDDDRAATPDKRHAPERSPQLFMEQDVTGGAAAAVPWALPGLSPAGSYASPGAVSMELTGGSADFSEAGRSEDLSQLLTGEPPPLLGEFSYLANVGSPHF
jgi:hypothetical protein